MDTAGDGGLGIYFMDKKEKIELPTGATFIVIRPDGKILMQLRDSGKEGKPIKYPDTWVLPGGGAEPGESHIQCAIREFYEEYRVRLAEKDFELLMMHQAPGTAEYPAYIVRMGMEFDPPLLEGAALEWWPLEKIKATKLAFEQERIVEKLEEYLA